MTYYYFFSHLFEESSCHWSVVEDLEVAVSLRLVLFVSQVLQHLVHCSAEHKASSKWEQSRILHSDHSNYL